MSLVGARFEIATLGSSLSARAIPSDYSLDSLSGLFFHLNLILNISDYRLTSVYSGVGLFFLLSEVISEK